MSSNPFLSSFKLVRPFHQNMQCSPNHLNQPTLLSKIKQTKGNQQIHCHLYSQLVTRLLSLMCMGPKTLCRRPCYCPRVPCLSSMPTSWLPTKVTYNGITPPLWPIQWYHPLLLAAFSPRSSAALNRGHESTSLGITLTNALKRISNRKRLFSEQEKRIRTKLRLELMLVTESRPNVRNRWDTERNDVSFNCCKAI